VLEISRDWVSDLRTGKQYIAIDPVRWQNVKHALLAKIFHNEWIVSRVAKLASAGEPSSYLGILLREPVSLIVKILERQ
jgi:hypothetical protein